MPELELFQAALGLTPPWRVVGSNFDAAAGKLTIDIDFPRGSRFNCPTCRRAECPVYDVEPKRWRHLNFWQYETVLTARLPRITCERCGVRQAEVSWARAGSGFTVLFEALVLTLAKEMPVHAMARLFREHDQRIWRIIHFHIDRARAKEDFSQVRPWAWTRPAGAATTTTSRCSSTSTDPSRTSTRSQPTSPNSTWPNGWR